MRSCLPLRGLLLIIVLEVFNLPPAEAREAELSSVTASSDGHFIATADGQPFFWLGDTGWSIFTRLTREEADLYLRDRAEKGFNVIQAVAAGAPYDDLDVPNRYGEIPFIDQDPSRPNPAYFAHVDWIIEQAAARGIRFALLPIWGGSQIHDKEFLTVSTAREYGKWIARRYRGKGILWVLGGDINPVSLASVKKKELAYLVDRRFVYDAMAAGITEGDGGDPFITYHPTAVSFSGTPQPRTSLYLHDRPWLDMNMLQSAHFANGMDFIKTLGADFVFDGTRNYEPVLEEYRSSPTRPVIDGEPRFEDLAIDLDEAGARGFWSGYDARNAAYHAVFAGAAGHTYGNHYIWQFYEDDGTAESPSRLYYQLVPKKLNWQEAIKRPVSAQLRHLKSLMLSRPYFTRIPDQSLVVGDAGEGTAHIGAARDRNGDYAMLYLPHGQKVTVDLAKLSGAQLIGWWYDPRTGSATRISGRIPRAGTRSFNPLSNGKENDWVLILDNETRSFAAPGAQPGSPQKTP